MSRPPISYQALSSSKTWYPKLQLLPGVRTQCGAGWILKAPMLDSSTRQRGGWVRDSPLPHTVPPDRHSEGTQISRTHKWGDPSLGPINEGSQVSELHKTGGAQHLVLMAPVWGSTSFPECGKDLAIQVLLPHLQLVRDSHPPPAVGQEPPFPSSMGQGPKVLPYHPPEPQ